MRGKRFVFFRFSPLGAIRGALDSPNQMLFDAWGSVCLGAGVGRCASPSGFGAANPFLLDLFVSSFILGSMAFGFGVEWLCGWQSTEVALNRVLI